MKNLVTALLVFGLGVNSFAGSNHLSVVTQTISLSKDVDSFFEKLFPNDKAFQKGLKEFAKKNNITALPKFRYEKNILTLIAPDRTITTMEVVNPAEGEFKINGQDLKISIVDDLFAIIQKVNDVVTKKSASWFNVLIPEANAELLLAVGAIVLTVVAAGSFIYYQYAPTCRNLGKQIHNHLGKLNKNSHTTVNVVQINSCDRNKASFNITDTLQPFKTLKLTYTKDEFSQEGKLEQEFVGENPSRKIEYTFTQGNAASEAIFGGATENSGPVSEPVNGRTEQNFKLYQKLAQAFVGNAGKRCSECEKSELANQIKFPGYHPKPGQINQEKDGTWPTH